MKRILEQLFKNEYDIGWKQTTIKEMLTRVRIPVDVEPEEEYQEIGIYSHGRGIFHKEKVTGKKIGNKAVYWIEPECFVFNIIFAWEQAVAKTTNREKGMIASHRFPMYKPKEGILDLDYILYFFKTRQGKHLLYLASPGGAGRNKTLGQVGFQQLSIPLPSIIEQHKIVNILATWDKAIDKTDALIKDKEKLKKGLMQQLLTGKKRFSEYYGYELETKKFGDILNIKIGGTPSRKNPAYWDVLKETKNRWISISDLNNKYISETKEYISNIGIKNSNAKLLKEGTVIMSFKLTIGKASILAKSCYTNEAIVALIPKNNEGIDREYLYQALNVVDFKKEIDPAVKGKTLNKEKIARLQIQLPSIKEQKKIAIVLSKADDEIYLLRKKLEALIQQRKGLMQQLLTGRRRVNT